MKTIFTLLLFISGISTQAQEVNNFSLLNVKDNKNVSLSNFTSVSVIVIIFTSQECPFDNYYKDRLKELIQTYAGKVQFLLINSNAEIEESADQMAIHYTDLHVPYLADKEQAVMMNLGAKKTPEAFIITSKGGKFMVAYNGALDDNPQAAQDVRNYFLKDAIENTLRGQKVEPSTQRATGCTLRKK